MAITLTGVNHPHYGYISLTSTGDPSYTSVTRLVLKRKILSESKFTSVYTRTVSSVSRLNFSFNDYYCRNGYEYQYKLTYLNEQDNIVDEKVFNIVSSFDVLVVCDKDEIWYTPLNVSAINPTTIKPFAINSPILSRKPSYYSVTAINYEEGTCKGVFLRMTGPENDITFETEHNWKYRKDFKNWLTLGNAKVIKSVSGEMWLVGLKTDSITDVSLFDNAEIEGARQLEFGWLEVGDVDSEADMYENNLINVPSGYWSGV